jgi:hypothetical protein
MQDKMENELFIVNYAHPKAMDNWGCQLATHSYQIAKETAQELRVMGYSVRVQPVSLTDEGKIKL